MIEGIWRDLTYAARSLARARAFTAVSVISLGIGMVPVIAIPYASRLSTLTPPGVSTSGLVELVTTRVGPRAATSEWSYPDFVDLRAADTGATLSGWTFASSDVRLQPSGTKTPTRTMFVSADYFRTLGVTLARGPGFDVAMDDPLKAAAVVILDYDFWQNRLNSDPDIVGKTLLVNDVPHVVVGIAPERFAGHLIAQGAGLYMPLERHPNLLADDKARSDRDNRWLDIHGRLSPGVTVAQASAAVSTVTSNLAKQYPATNEFKAGIVAAYDPVGVLVRSQFRILQAVGLTLTGMVLLVVCLNVAGMMQVRTAMRERELSIRQAVGATRARLAGYLLAEAILLASAGGLLASLLVFNLSAILSWFAGQPIPPVQFQDALRVDWSSIVVSIGLCLVTSLLFGFLPAMRFSRPVIISSLKDDAGAGGLRVGRVHRVTAALQVAMAVPLLVMGGISLDRVRSTATSDLGFQADLIYAAPLTHADRITGVRENLAMVSGVASVTVADGLPLDFQYRMKNVSLEVDANTAPRWIRTHVTRIGDKYLDTLGIPLVRGRAFAADDTAGADRVTIISQALAAQLFPDADPGQALGKRLMFGIPGAGDQSRPQVLTIVGVTADFPTSQMSTTREQLLLPLAQYSNVGRDFVAPGEDGDTTLHLMLIARSLPGEQPTKMTAALENVVHQVEPEFKTTSIVTGRRLRQNSMNDFLTQTMVAGMTGGVILLLSALGIYGVVGLMVSTRTREIAVRVALGASRRRVVGMILLDVVKLVTPGIVIGLVLTAVLIRINGDNMGIPLSQVENLAYVVGAAVAVLVAVVASLVPARRAASVPPMVAMRSE